MELEGIKLGSYSAGTDNTTSSAQATYIVRDLTTPDPFAALDCPGLPEMGDAHPTRGDLRVQRIEATIVDDSNNCADVVVTWGLPGGVIGPSSVQQVQWDISTGAATTQVSRNGKTMGFTSFFNSVDPIRYTNPPIRDDNSEIGFEYLAPQVEAQVTLPVPATFVPLVSFGHVGKVNDAVFTCDGVQFAAREALLAAVSAKRVSPAPANQYEIGYRFLFGRSQLPVGLPVFLDGTDPVNITEIPIGDGYKIMFRALRDANNRARSLEDVAIRDPIGVAVYQIYHERDFSQLGVT